MGKISNKELAEILTEKHGLSKQDAEKFVTKMFEVVGDGLQADKLVKVKGLGTFKVVSVASRKSVDVNTGEPIVIEGRDKISFTPDASMRDAVNRPFAQFETVVLNDGVDFSDIDKKYEESEEEKTEEEQPATAPVTEQPAVVVEPKEVETPIFVEEPKKEIEEPKIEETVEKNAEENAEETVEEEKLSSASVEPVIEQKEEDKTPQEPIVEKEIKIEEEKEEKEIKIEEEKEEKEIKIEEEEKEKEVEDDVEAKIQSAQHRTLKYVCIAAGLIIVLLGASAFYLFNQLQLRDNRIENLEAQVLEKRNKKNTPKKNVNVMPANKTQEIVSTDGKTSEGTTTEETSTEPLKLNTTTEPTIQKSSVKEKKVFEQKTADKNSEKEASASNENNTSKEYSKDVRIRTGAYNIIGIDRSVTVKAGQTLSSISRSQLGPGMECYIEAVNGGKTEFKAGEKVKIPKLKLKKRK